MKKLIVCLLMAALLIPGGLCESEYDVAAAVEALKACWREEYSLAENLPGYLEIKNTRIVTIAETPKAAEESMQQCADELFGDVDYIVEFMLYCDPMGMAPYYQNAGNRNCVVVREDGSMEVPVNDLFNVYRARTYSMDISGIVADVIDFNQEYNGIYHLMEE